MIQTSQHEIKINFKY